MAIRLWAVALALALCCGAAMADKTTRRNIKTQRSRHVAEATAAVADTIAAEQAAAMVRFSGYEKTLRASRETVLATNLTDTVDITAVVLQINYLDRQGRQLNQATHTVRCSLPPGQTRVLTFPTFDRQHTYYFHATPPARSAIPLTPFWVEIQAVALIPAR